MLKKIHKLFVNFEKEEKWLNEMAGLGLNFKHYSIGTYLFEEGTPGEYIYRLELLPQMPQHPGSEAYIKFSEETGTEFVDSYFRWVFFRKKSVEGDFELYTDYDSRIKHYKRVLWLTGIVWILNLFAGLYNLFIAIFLIDRPIGSMNSYCSLISLGIFIAFIPMIISYIKKIKKMKKEKQLHE